MPLVNAYWPAAAPGNVAISLFSPNSEPMMPFHNQPRTLTIGLNY